MGLSLVEFDVRTLSVVFDVLSVLQTGVAVCETYGKVAIAAEAHVTEEEAVFLFRFLAVVVLVLDVPLFAFAAPTPVRCVCLEPVFFAFTRVASRFQSSGIRGSPLSGVCIPLMCQTIACPQLQRGSV
jgi:hypothetical protein